MSAVFSADRRYRYRLDRCTQGGGLTTVVMVNPSTADETTNDATIRKLIGFGSRNSWGDLMIVNLFALCATDVKELGKVQDPIGPDNDSWLHGAFLTSDRIIAAWGPVSKQPRAHRGRWKEVMGLAQGIESKMFSIGEPALCGHPKHPLFQSYESPMKPWRPWHVRGKGAWELV